MRNGPITCLRATTIVFVLVCALASEALAQGAGDFSQEEYRALPRMCLAQPFINGALRAPLVPEAERREWATRLGEEDYKHFHHYCWALMLLRRANAAGNPRDRNFEYGRAVRNFEYVQRAASPQFPMMPEVNLRKGLTLVLLGKHAAAAKEFVGAIRLKPDYSPAYAALVDLYIDLEDLEAAKDTLEAGLAHAPDSKLLASKQTELDSLGAKP